MYHEHIQLHLNNHKWPIPKWEKSELRRGGDQFRLVFVPGLWYNGRMCPTSPRSLKYCGPGAEMITEQGSKKRNIVTLLHKVLIMKPYNSLHMTVFWLYLAGSVVFPDIRLKREDPIFTLSRAC